MRGQSARDDGNDSGHHGDHADDGSEEYDKGTPQIAGVSSFSRLKTLSGDIWRVYTITMTHQFDLMMMMMMMMMTMMMMMMTCF